MVFNVIPIKYSKIMVAEEEWLRYFIIYINKIIILYIQNIIILYICIKLTLLN